MSTVLVTGGTGLYGSAVREYVEHHPTAFARWVFLSSKDGDLRSASDTHAIFATHRPTHVLHLAAVVGGLYANLAHKVEFYRHNVLMNDNVMEAARVHKVQKVISVLSTCIFPDVTAYPLTEGMIHAGPPHPSNEGYAYAKRMVDVMSRAYTEEYPPSLGGCTFTTVVPCNIYGVRDNFNIEGGHVVPGLIHKCYLAARAGGGSGGTGGTAHAPSDVVVWGTAHAPSDVVVWGSGTPLRQFIHAADLAELTVWALGAYDDPSPLILAPDEGDEVSIAQLASMVVAGTEGFTGRLVFDTSKADGQHRKTASNAKLRGLRPDFAFKPMAEGVGEVCAWFRAHFDEARK